MDKSKTINAITSSSEKNREIFDSNDIDTASRSTDTRMMTSWETNARIIQNFRLVWLDSSIDEVNDMDCINTLTTLRQVVNTVNTFSNVEECIDFITRIEKEKIFMIVSGALGQRIAPAVQDIIQITYVCIFCQDKERHEQWTKECPKVKGVYTDIIHICEALKQAARNCDQNSISFHFIMPIDETSNQNLDQLDQSFMYTQLIKETLLTIDFEQEHINNFLTYCREQFAGNSAQLKNIDKFEKDYSCHHRPIWWYTHEHFIYSMLNRALRLMEIDIIIKMGFFLRDLHNEIVALHSKQDAEHHRSDSFTVYRGQGLSHTDFDQLLQTKGGLMSFNNFLSTSYNQAVALRFAESNQDDSDLIGVLFEITLNPSTSSFPFANVQHLSHYRGEQEILFPMHSVFRIEQAEANSENNRLWRVNLKLTNDNDPQLHALTKSLQEEIEGSKGWLRLGKLMFRLGQYNKTEELLDLLRPSTTDDIIRGDIYFQLGQVRNGQRKYAEALTNYKNSLEIRQRNLTTEHRDVAECYNNLGNVYANMCDYSKALLYHEKALQIQEKILPPNHTHLAVSYRNIGFTYAKTGEYSKALSYYQRTTAIMKTALSTNHPDLVTSYYSIGEVYQNMNEHSQALSYHKKALQIYQKTLPPDHPDLATSYNNIGVVYHNMGEYSKALSYHEKAAGIRQKTSSSRSSRSGDFLQ